MNWEEAEINLRENSVLYANGQIAWFSEGYNKNMEFNN